MRLLRICWVAVFAVTACGSRAGVESAGGASTFSATPSIAPPASASPAATPVHTQPAVDVVNRVLAQSVRELGRSGLRICLYVDPATGLDASDALVQLQDSIDALAAQGYTAIASRASLCPEVPLYLRTNTVHFKNSRNGPVALPVRVTTPSPFILFVALTTAARIETIFGELPMRRGTEEMTCSGDNCGGVTESIYADPTAYSDVLGRQRLLLDGLGLLGDPTRP